MDGDLHSALSRFVLEHHRDIVVVLDKAGRVVDKSASAKGAELDIAGLFDTPVRDLRIDAFVEELDLSGQAHTLVASPAGAVFRLEGTAVDKYRIVVAHQLSRADDVRPSLGIVAASFVHDLNNLLMPILLLSGRLRRDLQAMGEQRSESAMIANEIHSSATLAASLARDVLNLSRPRMENIERVDVDEMLSELERLIRRLAGPRVDVLFALGKGVELETRLDRKRLEHAVLSLVVAARDAMPDGGHLAITTALVEHGGVRRIALSLTDTGDREAKDEPPRSVDGFAIDVSSARGQGTSVTLLLEPAPPSTAPAPPAEAAEAAKGHNVIMVAERDELVRRAIQRVLESHGWTVVSVGSQDDALEAAAVHPLRVAMLDSAIFRRAPTAFLHQLRALAPKMRLVLLADQSIGEAVPHHVIILPKPFGDEELVRAVRQALG